MRASRFLIVALAAALLLCGAAAGEPVAAARGHWRGAITERSGGWPAEGSAVELRVDGSPERFAVTVAAPWGPLVVGEFAPGARENVFGPPQARGFKRLLGRGTAANPLEGRPLAWARREGEMVVVYLLDLRGGPYRLDRLVLTPAGDRLQLAFERREHDRAPERVAATLERVRP